MTDDDSTGSGGRHRAAGSDEPPWPLSEQRSSTGDGNSGVELPQVVGRDEEADEEADEEEVADDDLGRHRGWKYIYRTRIRTSTLALVVALIGLSVLFMYTSEYYGTEPATPTRTQAPDGDEVWVTPSVTPRESEPKQETTPTTGESEAPVETVETGETGTQTTGPDVPTQQSPDGGAGNQPQQQQQEQPQTTTVPSG